jgi:hypothetical protein
MVHRLTVDDEPIVVRAVCRAAARLGDTSLITRLIGWLGVGAVRHSVRDALARFDDAALDALERALEDPAGEASTQRHLPRTLGCIRSPRAFMILARNLGRHRDGVVNHKILLALGRCADLGVGQREALALVVAYATTTVQRVQRLRALRIQLARTIAGGRIGEAGRLLVTILDDEIDVGTERLFRALAIVYPHRGLADLPEAIAAADPARRAAAGEVLDNVLDFELRAWVQPLCDDLPDDRFSAVVARRLGPLPRSHEQVLDELAQVDETFAKLVAYHRRERAEAA